MTPRKESAPERSKTSILLSPEIKDSLIKLALSKGWMIIQNGKLIDVLGKTKAKAIDLDEKE
ncbi:MAG: hypothetical protein ABI758_01660 [Candidatus Woesebacteria bacterium]